MSLAQCDNSDLLEFAKQITSESRVSESMVDKAREFQQAFADLDYDLHEYEKSQDSEHSEEPESEREEREPQA